jgi:hypothetical protein
MSKSLDPNAHPPMHTHNRDMVTGKATQAQPTEDFKKTYFFFTENNISLPSDNFLFQKVFNRLKTGVYSSSRTRIYTTPLILNKAINTFVMFI